MTLRSYSERVRNILSSVDDDELGKDGGEDFNFPLFSSNVS